MSKEDRARVFALYLGCDLDLGDNEHTATLAGVGMDDFTSIEHSTGSYGEHSIHDQSTKLILKDLSEISDEDAVEVAKILKVSYSNNPESDACFDITGLAYFLQELFETGSDVMSVTGDKFLLLSDYLRSKSYMLPYKGQDLFTTGIAVKESL